MHVRTMDTPLQDGTVARARAGILVVAPLVFLAALVYHPHITFLPDARAVAHAVHADTTRWAIAHWGIAIGSALLALAFLALRGYLSDAGENRWSAIALPFLVFSAAVYAILPGMEFTVLAAARTGGDVVASQQVIDTWFVPTMLLAGVTNAVGMLLMARAILRSRVLAGSVRSLVIAAFFVLAVSRLVPVGPVQFHVQGLAGILALWPISAAVNRQVATRRTGHPSPMPAG